MAHIWMSHVTHLNESCHTYFPNKAGAVTNEVSSGLFSLYHSDAQVCVGVKKSLSVCLSVYLSVCLSVCLSVYLSICLSGCLSVCLSICLSGFLVLRLYVSATVCVYVWHASICERDESRFVQVNWVTFLGEVNRKPNVYSSCDAPTHPWPMLRTCIYICICLHICIYIYICMYAYVHMYVYPTWLTDTPRTQAFVCNSSRKLVCRMSGTLTHLFTVCLIHLQCVAFICNMQGISCAVWQGHLFATYLIRLQYVKEIRLQYVRDIVSFMCSTSHSLAIRLIHLQYVTENRLQLVRDTGSFLCNVSHLFAICHQPTMECDILQINASRHGICPFVHLQHVSDAGLLSFLVAKWVMSHK